VATGAVAGETKKILRREANLRRKGFPGMVHWVVSTTDFPYTAGMTQDPADRNVYRSRKFEALGRLTSGITHEINTPIQYIGQNLEFLAQACQTLLQAYRLAHAVLNGAATARALDPAALQAWREQDRQIDLAWFEREIPAAIRESQVGLAKARKIALAVKDVTHPSLHEVAPADLNQALDTVQTITRHAWKDVATVRLELAPDLPRVVCCRDEIDQVLINLVVNAAQALQQRSARAGAALGTIVLATRAAGDHVEISVQDDGPGMPPEVQARLFTPGFTTKPAGQGTGQGLALARTIIQDRHHGSLSFTSEPGKGTTFLIRLPIAPPPGTDTPAGGGPPPATEGPRSAATPADGSRTSQP
jgi:signal transduction histidine kinase